VKIYFHFLLAKLASLAITRDFRDSMPGKQAEKTFRLASFPAVMRPGKQPEAIDNQASKQWKGHSGEEHSGEGTLRKPIHSS